MPISDEKFPWESYTEWTAFIGLVVGLAASFGYIALTTEQIGAITGITFLLVMIARKVGAGGKIVLKKAPEELSK
jgi:hypothetical protein